MKQFIDMAPFLFYIWLIFLHDIGVSALDVSLKSDSPVVRGSSVTFTATVQDYNGEILSFEYTDNVQPQHKYNITLSANTSSWTVTYPKDLYEAGEYTASVRLLKKYLVFWIPESYNTTTFKLTDQLNGKMSLTQNNTERSNDFVAVNETVVHSVTFPKQEMDFLKENSSSIVTHWFVDCVYFGMTTDFSFNYTYNDSMSDHNIEAVVVANNEPLPPLTTTTTTTLAPPTPPNNGTNTTTQTTIAPATTLNSTTTTILSTTTSPTTTMSVTTDKTTTVNPRSSVNISQNVEVKNDSIVKDSSGHKVQKRAISNKTFKNSGNLFKCNNDIPFGDSITLGRVERTISVRAPISKVNITGRNWLPHGDLLNLQVKFTGSPPFDYCVQYKRGIYNITGNETCDSKTRIYSYVVPLVHYFSDSDQYTVVFIVQNDLGQVAEKNVINIYKMSTHSQLSVIVVPVFFCLVAMILIVFGIAYYQHRSRHTIEVADFDFGQENPEYKTFTERLRDSFRNAFNFRQRDDTDPLTPDIRYDSMT